MLSCLQLVLPVTDYWKEWYDLFSSAQSHAANINLGMAFQERERHQPEKVNVSLTHFHLRPIPTHTTHDTLIPNTRPELPHRTQTSRGNLFSGCLLFACAAFQCVQQSAHTSGDTTLFAFPDRKFLR